MSADPQPLAAIAPSQGQAAISLRQRFRRVLPSWIARHFAASAPGKSFVFIQSIDPKIGLVGSGFVVHRESETAYVLTAAHNWNNASGAVRVDGIDAGLVAMNPEADLAVLKTEISHPAMDLLPAAAGKGTLCTVYGCRPAAKTSRDMEPVDCTVKTEGLLLVDRVDPASDHAAAPSEPSGGGRSISRVPIFKVVTKAGELKQGYSGGPVIEKRSGGLMGVFIQGAELGTGDNRTTEGIVVSINALLAAWNPIPGVKWALRPRSFAERAFPWVIAAIALLLICINVWPFLSLWIARVPTKGYAQQCGSCNPGFTEKNWATKGHCSLANAKGVTDLGGLKIEGQCAVISKLGPLVRTHFEFVVSFASGSAPLSWLVEARPENAVDVRDIDGVEFEVDPAKKEQTGLPAVQGWRVYPRRWWNLLELAFSKRSDMVDNRGGGGDKCSGAFQYLLIATDVLDDRVETKVSVADYPGCSQSIRWSNQGRRLSGTGNFGWIGTVHTAATISNFQVCDLRRPGCGN